MKKLSFFLSLAVGLMLCTSTANAAATEIEDDATTSHLFVGVQGGGQATFSNYDFSKMILPYGAVYFGGYYNPVVGGRLHAMGYRSKGGFKSLDRSYYYNYYTADADLLINLSNLFWKKNQHFANLVLIGGVGLNYAWHNRDFKNIIAQNPGLLPQASEYWKGSNLSHNFRLGLQLDLAVSKHIGINLEADFNNLNDKFNSKMSNKCDWMLNAGVGLSYKFAYKTKKVVLPPPPPAPAPAPVPAPKPAPAPAPAPKPEPKPAPAPAPVVKTINENIFYDIRSSAVPQSELSKVEKVANFLKENPEATVEIVGYADKKTGNPTINMKYSQKRANDLKNMLVNKYGINGSRISASAKGDTVQPFAENVKNRVSIISGTTKK
ncbi:MAG: OmpA family protein [Bacteroidaceae bacterium]|nr:OmpA family protein [Bacteroidaceae bacterium]